MQRQESIDFAKKYLEDILSFFSLNATISVSEDDDVVELNVPSSELNSILIGRNAETLRSLQYIVSTTLRNKDAELTRVNVDIADYKKQHAEKVAVQAREWIAIVRSTAEPLSRDLNAADRRVVHQVATEFEDIQTSSEGEGRERRITISPKTAS